MSHLLNFEKWLKTAFLVQIEVKCLKYWFSISLVDKCKISYIRAL